MIFKTDDHDYFTELKQSTCEFHKKNPGKEYAGCTCSVSYIRKSVIAKTGIVEDSDKI